MKKILLITVTYTDSTQKFWMDSSIKNKRVTFNPDSDNIHEVVKEVCSELDGMELAYKGKPQGNIYCDTLDKEGTINGYKTIGYIYRGYTEIHDRDMVRPQTGRFDVWVSIDEVIAFPIEDLS